MPRFFLSLFSLALACSRALLRPARPDGGAEGPPPPDDDPGGDRARRRRAHFHAVLAAFSGLGFHVGVWVVLLADLASSLGLTPGSLGLALSAKTASGVAALVAGGRLVDRLGRRPALLLGAGGTGAFFLLMAGVSGPAGGGYPALLLAFVVGGACSGAWDLAANALGGDHEREHGVRAMAPLHAGFSFGAAAGALASGAALAGGAGFRAVYVAVGAALLVLSAALWRAPLPRRPREEREGPKWERSGGSDGRHPAPRRRSRPLVLVPAVAACASAVFLAFSADAALEGFLSIYLRGTLSSGALLGGAGLASLYLAGALGILAVGAVLGRVGERRVLALCGLAGAAGMAAVLSAGRPALAAAALLVVGAATAPVAPVVFSLVARAVPGASGQAISLVTVSGYAAFTVSPPLVGSLADLTSLRVSLLLLVASCLGVAAVARAMPPVARLNPPGGPDGRDPEEG